MSAADHATSRGQDLADRLFAACGLAENAPLPGARDLPALTGLTQDCAYLQPLENVAARARKILVDSGMVYVYGDSVVLEMGEPPDQSLVPLARGHKLESYTPALLANVFVCEHAKSVQGAVQFAPPTPFVGVLLNSTPTLKALPRIRIYATRVVFDEQFLLHGSGWHPESGILVHGPSIEPVIPAALAPELPLLERLPPHLRTLLGDFCFRSPADLVNAVGAMLTGLLVSSFVSPGKAVVLLDGNQPGLGKTLLARVIGVLLDGLDPQLIHYTPDDEELAKRICATLRGSPQSLLLIDNAKVKAGSAVSSPVIEANSMAPQVSLRILGQSSNYVRPNDLLWFLTMNDTRTSPDLVSRGLPIRFWYDGDPGARNFGGRDPVAYATEHRTELLGELAGMVLGWNQAGRPPGPRPHRCGYWAQVVGGVLQSAGLPEFLANLDEAAATFNAALDELAALAETVAAAGDPGFVTFSNHLEGGDS